MPKDQPAAPSPHSDTVITIPTISVGSIFAWLIAHIGVGAQIFALIQRFMQIEEPFDTVAGLKLRIAVALDGLRLEAAMTTTTIDDQALAMLTSLSTNDAILETIAGILHRVFPQTLDLAPHERAEVCALALASDEDLAESVEAAGINWKFLLQLLPSILGFILLFISPNPNPTPAQ